MNLSPITSPEESKAAIEELMKRLQTGATPFRRNVGWQGGHEELEVHWHRKEHFWVTFGFEHKSRYWCAYGTEEPSPPTRSLNITCEINPPKHGIDRRCGGVFLKGPSRGLYLAHTGKLGGGRKGIGKSAFLDFYGSDPPEIEWPNGDTEHVIVLGKVSSSNFPSRLAGYLREVEAFKAGAARRAPDIVTETNPDLVFRPEFEGAGSRRKYKLSKAIESQCNHKTVVESLHAELRKIGIESYNTREIDLFLANARGRITHVLEVKTDQNTTSLYQAVGQAMWHGALQYGDPRRTLVLPGAVTTKTASRLKKLGISVLPYEWKGDQPVFAGLREMFG